VVRAGVVALVLALFAVVVTSAWGDDEATPLTVRCDAKAWQAFLEKSGQVRLIEYRFGTQYNNFKPTQARHPARASTARAGRPVSA